MARLLIGNVRHPLINNLTTATEGAGALDAAQGKVLDGKKVNIADIVNNLTTTTEGKALDARQGKALADANDELNRNIENKIVIGATKDAMMLITESSMAFSEGTATLNASSIATTYGKTISNAIAHFKSAGGTVITSTTVANNVITARARNIEINAPYGGTIPCVIYLFLK